MRKPRAPRRTRLAPTLDLTRDYLAVVTPIGVVWPSMCRRCDCAHCLMMRDLDATVDVDGSNVTRLD